MATLKLKIVRPGSFECFPSQPLDDGLTPRSSSAANVPNGENCGWTAPAWLKPMKEVGLVQLLLVDNGSSRAGRTSTAQSYYLRGKPWITIGRSEQACVRLQHPTASRAHAALLHCVDGMLYLIDFGSAHGTNTGGSAAKPVPVHLPVAIPSGTLLRFGDVDSPLFLVKYCTKQQLLGHHPLHRQAMHPQIQLPFTPTCPHLQSIPNDHHAHSDSDSYGDSSPDPDTEPPRQPNPYELDEHPSPQQEPQEQQPPPDAHMQPAPQLHLQLQALPQAHPHAHAHMQPRFMQYHPEPGGEDDGCDPLTPHTMINTQLNAVLPSFIDPRRQPHAFNKRIIDQVDTTSPTATHTPTAPLPSPQQPRSKRVCKRVCFNSGPEQPPETAPPTAVSAALQCEHPECEVTIAH